MKTLYLINHSHTDIGYTAVQELIMQYHVDYINQAIGIIEDELSSNNKCDYVWTCENYWQVKNYLANATEEQIKKFETYIEAGYIDFGLNYFNMTELVDTSILNEYLAEAQEYAKKFTRKHDSSMTADINGFAWSYSDSLLNYGTNNLFTCVHGHHGIYPLFKTQVPFWWESPSGKKLLVWNGEHYHFGNETYILQNAQTTYQFNDQYAGDLTTDQFIVAKQRIFNYFDELEESGYPYSFAPLMISGFTSDNAAPSEDLVAALSKWNQEFGDIITIKVIGLNDFFEILREEDLSDLPTYSGDWNDWWSDGVGSTPAATKIYKNAIRNYRLLKEIGAEARLNSPLGKQAKENLMLYAEHTWGYSSSVTEPWNTLVNELEYRKLAYSVNGSSQIGTLQIKEYIDQFDYAMPSLNRKQRFKIINPYDKKIRPDVKLFIEEWEHFEGVRVEYHLMEYMEVFNLETGEEYLCQVIRTARGYEITITPNLEAEEIMEVGVRLSPQSKRKSSYIPFIKGAENVKDIIYEGKENDYVIETDYYTVHLCNQKGIDDIIYKPLNQSILDSTAEYPLFSGVYEKTEIVTNPYTERRRMGRNRKGRHAKRYTSTMKNIEIIERGPVYTSIQIDWELEGTQMFSNVLKIYQHIPKIEATFRIQKTNEWGPENLYIPLSVTLDSERFFKKSGSLFRPAIDQLPGTNTEFYLLDTGIIYRDENGTSLAICPKDTPLVTLGDIENHPIHLFNSPDSNKNAANLYSWVMNNFWETNFKVDLSGFYEFSYSIIMTENTTSILEADELLDIENQGVIVVQI